MKKIHFLMLILICGGAVWAYPSQNKKDLSKNRELRQSMQRLETHYFNLALLANSKNLEFDVVQKQLGDMEALTRKIRVLGVRPELDSPLKALTAQIGSLKKEVSQEDPIHLRKGIDQLYETCFRCHALHAPTQK